MLIWVFRPLVWLVPLPLMLWAASDPRFRDAEGFFDTPFCLPLACSIACLPLGWALDRRWRRFCLWIALALLSQAAGLQLIDAGPRIHYQHYLGWDELLAGTNRLLLAFLGLQTVCVVLGIWARPHQFPLGCGATFAPGAWSRSEQSLGCRRPLSHGMFLSMWPNSCGPPFFKPSTLGTSFWSLGHFRPRRWRTGRRVGTVFSAQANRGDGGLVLTVSLCGRPPGCWFVRRCLTRSATSGFLTWRTKWLISIRLVISPRYADHARPPGA